MRTRRAVGGRGIGAGQLVELDAAFFARPVEQVARELIGCGLVHGSAGGVIVETEAYHQSEPACHAFIGKTTRNAVLFGPAAHVYVYFSYGMHNMLNFVTGEEGVGAAVLIRSIEPTAGEPTMHRRRATDRVENLCSGPGKLAQALGIELGHNGAPLAGGPIRVVARESEPETVASRRIGISKAVELPWRFSAAGSRFVSRPRPV